MTDILEADLQERADEALNYGATVLDRIEEYRDGEATEEDLEIMYGQLLEHHQELKLLLEQRNRGAESSTPGYIRETEQIDDYPEPHASNSLEDQYIGETPEEDIGYAQEKYEFVEEVIREVREVVSDDLLTKGEFSTKAELR